MPIIYTKLFLLLKKKGITSYRIRQDKLLGQATLQKLRSGNGIIDTRTIEKLCEMLECQPGDIIEYIPPVPEQEPTDLKGRIKKLRKEKGTAAPDCKTLIGISKLFDCSTDYLLGISEIRELSTE